MTRVKDSNDPGDVTSTNQVKFSIQHGALNFLQDTQGVSDDGSGVAVGVLQTLESFSASWTFSPPCRLTG